MSISNNNNLQKEMEEKRSRAIDKYRRRMAVIITKYPDLLKAPSTIQQEYYSLSSLVDSLKTSRRVVWGESKSSDGIIVDRFVANKYETKLLDYKKYNLINTEYISQEEDKNFEYEKIDYDAFRQDIENMETGNDFKVIYDKIILLEKFPFPEAEQRKIDEILNEATDKCFLLKDFADLKPKMKSPEIPYAKSSQVYVEEKTLSKLYHKSKDKISEVYSKIKSKFLDKDNEKAETKEILEREE